MQCEPGWDPGAPRPALRNGLSARVAAVFGSVCLILSAGPVLGVFGGSEAGGTTTTAPLDVAVASYDGDAVTSTPSRSTCRRASTLRSARRPVQEDRDGRRSPGAPGRSRPRRRRVATLGSPTSRCPAGSRPAPKASTSATATRTGAAGVGHAEGHPGCRSHHRRHRRTTPSHPARPTPTRSR